MDCSVPSYTVESVRRGHPDKICDQISDALLDCYLKEDSTCHVAIECLGTKGNIIVAGEVSYKMSNNAVEDIVKKTYNTIGYNDNIKIINLLSYQSEQLRKPIYSNGANDQGIIYGYAEDSDFNYLPSASFIANAVAKKIDEVSHDIIGLLPDGKVLVTSVGKGIHRIAVNVQHSPDFQSQQLERELRLFLSTFPDLSSVEIRINSDNTFIEGGLNVDTGLTGRKIMVDTYGGLVSHGGGAFSGKDPTKIDRTGAYMARFVAKNIIANGLANKCTVALTYEFGKGSPSFIQVSTGEGVDKKLTDFVKSKIDFRPFAIIERFNLNHFQFFQTATYGHFANASYPWEEIISL